MMNDLLRHDMRFKDMMVTDWAEINNLYEFHCVAASKLEAVHMAIEQTSIDMGMVPITDEFMHQPNGLSNCSMTWGCWTILSRPRQV